MKYTVGFLLLFSGIANADLLTSIGGASEGIEVLEHGHATQGVCFAPLDETREEKLPDGAVPTFRRMHNADIADWAIDISAQLRHMAWRGNAIFTFYDLDDAGALDSERYVALYQATVPKGKEVYAHAHLSPAGGFVPGHKYRMRITQLINGQEIVLAESDLRLE